MQNSANDVMNTRMFKIIILFVFLILGLCTTQPAMSAEVTARDAVVPQIESNTSGVERELTAACPGGPSIDHILLDECYTESFLIGGVTKTITVWYTKAHHTPYDRTLANGDVITLSHWIDDDAQAEQVVAWGRLAWEQYYEIFGLSPYEGSTDIIYLTLEDGIRGYANIPSDGTWIHLGISVVSGAGDPLAVFHEFGHAVQDSYANCFLRDGIYPGNAEFTEGYACTSADAVEPVSEAPYYGGFVASYNHSLSFYEHSGDNVGNKYFLEQTGNEWFSAIDRFHMDAVREHYEQCNALGTNYAYDALIQDLTGGELNEKKLFLNFFAANWAKDWANPALQPELVYTDDDTVSYGQVPLNFDVSPVDGTFSLSWQHTPDVWAAKYYQFSPQPDCDFVSVRVAAKHGEQIGINLMAADTIGTTKVTRSAVIGTELSRTFPGAGVNDKIVAIVNAFDQKEYYSIEFECVTPTVTLVEPRPQPNSTRVGIPTSPIVFLAVFEVTDGGVPVMGIPESLFTAFAGLDGMSFVPGSFQEVGNQYWVLVNPPVQPDGTTYVDMSLCLEGGICDTNDDALLYEERGNSDVALVFDASGSMETEDVIGEGRRIDNAMRAGNVQAGLLQDGDRVLVMDFSAINDPWDCALPYGDGYCELDLQMYLERTDVEVPDTIADTRLAVNSIYPREWTPIGAALKEANYKLQEEPFRTNQKVIVLLSDGKENVNPLISDVVGDLQAAGTIVHTVGFGLPGEVGEDKLAQLAADTLGTFIFVPSSGTSSRSVSLEELEALREAGISETLIGRIASLWQPGPLALDAVYDYFDATAQGAHRLFSIPQVAVPNITWKEVEQYVDASTTELRFVVAGKQGENGSTIRRGVMILPPGADPNKGWIEISPADPNYLPANWDVRNSEYDDAVIITNPDMGVWKVKSLYNRSDGLPADFVMMASAQSDFILQGRFLAPIVDFQGQQGDVVPIVATLMDRHGGVKGASVIANILSPNGSGISMILQDDGMHSDGGEGDGVYGGLFAPTYIFGVYSVDIIAEWEDPNNPGFDTQAEWLGSFFIPKGEDLDGDRMPDAWESACGVSPSEFDIGGDLDGDGLSNFQEFTHGTSPCNDDTDHGGENDGSEVENSRDPLEPSDDVVHKLPHFSFLAMNGAIRIDWPTSDRLGPIEVFVSTDPDLLGTPFFMGDSGTYTLPRLTNDQPYYLTFRVWGVVSAVRGAYSEQSMVTPKTDPDPPSGFIYINDNYDVTHTRSVQLSLMAEDTLRLGDPIPIISPSGIRNEISGVAYMMISTDPFFTGAVWQDMAYDVVWELGENCYSQCRVFVKFRDAAGNESQVYSDSIKFEPLIYLPLMYR